MGIIHTIFCILGRRVRQRRSCTPERKDEREKQTVCFESDRGNRATRGKPVEQREKKEEHTRNSNHMRRTPTVHSGDRTRVLRGDKRESNLVATRASQWSRLIFRCCCLNWSFQNFSYRTSVIVFSIYLVPGGVKDKRVRDLGSTRTVPI